MCRFGLGPQIRSLEGTISGEKMFPNAIPAHKNEASECRKIVPFAVSFSVKSRIFWDGPRAHLRDSQLDKQSSSGKNKPGQQAVACSRPRRTSSQTYSRKEKEDFPTFPSSGRFAHRVSQIER